MKLFQLCQATGDEGYRPRSLQACQVRGRTGVTQARWGTLEGTRGGRSGCRSCGEEPPVCEESLDSVERSARCPSTRALGGPRTLPQGSEGPPATGTENRRAKGCLEGKAARATGEGNGRGQRSRSAGLARLQPRAPGCSWWHPVTRALRGDRRGQRGWLPGSGPASWASGSGQPPGIGALRLPFSPSGPRGQYRSPGVPGPPPSEREADSGGSAGYSLMPGKVGGAGPGTGGPRAPGRRWQGQCPGCGAGAGGGAV